MYYLQQWHGFRRMLSYSYHARSMTETFQVRYRDLFFYQSKYIVRNPQTHLIPGGFTFNSTKQITCVVRVTGAYRIFRHRSRPIHIHICRQLPPLLQPTFPVVLMRGGKAGRRCAGNGPVNKEHGELQRRPVTCFKA